MKVYVFVICATLCFVQYCDAMIIPGLQIGNGGMANKEMARTLGASFRAINDGSRGLALFGLHATAPLTPSGLEPLLTRSVNNLVNTPFNIAEMATRFVPEVLAQVNMSKNPIANNLIESLNALHLGIQGGPNSQTLLNKIEETATATGDLSRTILEYLPSIISSPDVLNAIIPVLQAQPEVAQKMLSSVLASTNQLAVLTSTLQKNPALVTSLVNWMKPSLGEFIKILQQSGNAGPLIEAFKQNDTFSKELQILSSPQPMIQALQTSPTMGGSTSSAASNSPIIPVSPVSSTQALQPSNGLAASTSGEPGALALSTLPPASSTPVKPEGSTIQGVTGLKV